MFALWSYRPRGGPYNALDERARILLAALGIAATLASWNPTMLAVCLAAAVSLVGLARIRFRELRRFALFAGLVTALLVTLTYATGEAPAPERRAHALAQGLRMPALFAFAVVLPFTLDPARYGLALRRLGLPDTLAFAVELAFRFVPQFDQRLRRTLEAQAARGLELSPERVSLPARLRRLVPLMVPVALGAVLAGEDLADAMDLRAFGTRRRTWLGETRFGPAEWAAVAAGGALLLAALLAR